MMYKTISVLALLVATINGEANILSLNVSSNTLENHHTGFFKMNKAGGFALRRGQEFQVIVETDGNLDSEDISFYNDKKDYNNPQFKVSAVEPIESSENLYNVSISTTASAPIGKYENITMSVGKSNNTFTYDKPVYLLFNPWSPEDVEVYLPTEALRKEHILNQYGNVYQGSLESWDSQKWYYGSGNQISLDAVFHLLENLNRADASNVTKIVQTMSSHQGMMRNKKTFKPERGDEKALLEGNWGDFPFTNDTSPEIWTSTVDILNRWQETGKPTQYGQCWVFGALQCSMMRTVGVGARQVTAFGAVIDMSLLHDKKHKSHHVIDTFYDLQGNQIYMDGQAWNFHSWTTIWMNYVNETLNTTYGGWHDLDGTPPGTIGPAPVQGTLALDEDFGYNVSQIVSTVHSTFRTFLTECDSKHKKGTKLDKKHCKVHKLMKYDHTGLKLIMTSASFENGTLTDGNVTTTYVNATTDAFIPYKDESEFIPFAKDYVDGDVSQRRVLRSSKDKKKPAKKVGKMIEGAVKIVNTDGNKVITGKSLEGSVQIDTSKFKQDEMVQVNLLFTLQNYQGGEIKTIESIQERVLIKGDMVSLPYVLDSASYLEKDMNDVFIKLVVTGTTEEKDNFFETSVIDVDSPKIEMEQSEIPEKAEFFEVKANFTNPYGFDLENVCLTIHSHELSFEGENENVTQIEKCTTLRADETITYSTLIQNPSSIDEQYQSDVYYILAQVNSADYLPYSQSNVEIRKTEETKVVEEQEPEINVQVIDLMEQELF